MKPDLKSFSGTVAHYQLLYSIFNEDFSTNFIIDLNILKDGSSCYQDQVQHMATEIWVNIGSGNGFLPDGTKPLPEPILTCNQLGPVAFIRG